MINKEKLEKYLKYNGDLDKWVASQKRQMDQTLSGDEWTQIDKVVQRILIQKRGFASKDYREETERVLVKTFESKDLIDQVKDIQANLNKA